MVKRDDLELDRLLARGLSSGPQYDDIEQRVMKRVAPRRKRWLWPTLVSSGLGFAAGAWLLVSAGTFSGLGSGELANGSSADGFRAKGTAPARASGSPLAFDVACGTSASRVCRLGDTLMFSLNPSGASGYLAAYAERVDEPSASRIWYFPAPGSAAPSVEATGATVVLPEGVRLGPPHVLGRYRVTAWLSESPISSASTQAPSARSSSVTFELVD
jgi:hypothetical protein